MSGSSPPHRGLRRPAGCAMPPRPRHSLARDLEKRALAAASIRRELSALSALFDDLSEHNAVAGIRSMASSGQEVEKLLEGGQMLFDRRLGHPDGELLNLSGHGRWPDSLQPQSALLAPIEQLSGGSSGIRVLSRQGKSIRAIARTLRHP